MKAWLQRLLGIEDLQMQIIYLRSENAQISIQATDIKKQLRVINLALGRIIAKLDPQYGISKHDPVRKAASDALGEEIIRKLQGEDHYSNRTRID